MIEAYPLCWPAHRPRTSDWKRESSRFTTSFAVARDELIREIRMLVGKYPDPQIIISTNIALRRDGLPLANKRQVDDTGVAVYFTYNKRQVCFACDRWKKIEDNMQAIRRTIEALRGVARWGTGDMMQAAFTGFLALPDPSKPSDWRSVFGFRPDEHPTRDELTARYRELVIINHPDRGGSTERMVALNLAREQAEKAIK